MEKKEISTDLVAKPFGIFSQGMQAGNLIFASGQVARNVQGELVGMGDIKAQTRQCLENLQAVLQAAGATMNDVVKVTMFVTNMDHLMEIHEVRALYFQPPYPASTLIQVSRFTNKDFLIEVEAIAVV